MVRICLLSYRGNPFCGGQGVYLYYLSRYLAEKGHQITVLVGPPYPPEMPWAKVIKIKNENFITRPGKEAIPKDNPFKVFQTGNFVELGLSRLGSNPEMLFFSLRAFQIIKRFFREGERFDLVHDNQSLGYGLLLIKQLGIPVVATIHHPLQVDRKEDLKQMPEFTRQVKRCLYYPLWMQKLVARRLDALLTVSETSRQLVSRWYKISASRIKKIYNGIDLARFRPLADIKKIPGRIIFVGSTEDRKKGILYLLRALKIVSHQQAHLVIVDGRLNPQRVYAKNLVKQMGLVQKVKFLEKIGEKELVQEYNSAQLAVIPSLFEGFGLPALEAMSCGTALIASRVGALVEVVGEGEEAGGILVNPADEKALAKEIDRVLFDDKLRAELERKARARAERYFSWEQTAGQMEKVYLEVLSQRQEKKQFKREG